MQRPGLVSPGLGGAPGPAAWVHGGQQKAPGLLDRLVCAIAAVFLFLTTRWQQSNLWLQCPCERVFCVCLRVRVRVRVRVRACVRAHRSGRQYSSPHALMPSGAFRLLPQLDHLTCAHAQARHTDCPTIVFHPTSPPLSKGSDGIEINPSFSMGGRVWVP